MREVDTFVVGDGATICYYSDRAACTVISVSKSGKRIKVQKDKQTLLNGMNSGEPDALVAYPGGFCAHVEGKQRYSYERDPNGAVYTFSLRENGRWVRSGDTARGGTGLVKGRSAFYDYNF